MYTGARNLSGNRKYTEDAILYQAYDDKKWQEEWEKLTGSNSTAPIRMMSGPDGQLQTNNMGFLQEQALDYKRKQQALSRQRFQENLDEEQWRDQYRRNRTYTPNASAMTAQPNQYGSSSSGPGPSMQNPFQF